MSTSDCQNMVDPCPICLNMVTNPVKLPCEHIFCFLCAKGAVLQTRKCPLCRRPVSISYFDNPQILAQNTSVDLLSFEDNHHWYYEGRNGWWLYDSDTSQEIEKEFQKEGAKQFEIVITGFVYVIDFEKMIQYRKTNPHKSRKIKRDQLDSQQTKGVAGLRLLVNGH